MGKGEKKQTDDNKRKRNREAKNEEILKQYHKIRERSEKKRKIMEEEQKKIDATKEEGEEVQEVKEVEEEVVEEKKEVTKKPHREKKHKKHHKEKEEKGEEEEDEDEKAIQQEAETPVGIEYLREWFSNREEWKFKKNRQTWLLKHVFDPKMLGVKDFKLFLAYMQDMQGRCRDELLEKAKRMAGEIVITDKKDEKSTIDRIQKKRAEKIIQLYG